MTDVPLRDPARDLTAPDQPTNPASTDTPTGRMTAALPEVRQRLREEQIGKPSPVAPAVSVLDARTEPTLRRRVECVVQCLQTVVRAYPDDPALQEFLDVPPSLHAWILQHHNPRLAPTIDVCRLDLLGDSLNTVRALEFNASSPGALVLLGMVNRLWRQSSFGSQLAAWGVPPAAVEEPTWFVEWLLDYGRRRGIAEASLRRVGVFHDHFTAGMELDQISDQLIRHGVEPVQLYPGEYDRLSQVRLGYLKHIAHDPAEVHGWASFLSAIAAGELVFPNALAQRWVAENKLCLAVLSDPRFRYLFDADQCEALDALIPVSRKLGKSMTQRQARAQQSELVLKAPYGARGIAVVLGETVSNKQWADLLEDPGHQGWLLQRRVEPSPMPDHRGHRDLVVEVLEGEVIGYASRIGDGDRLNMAQGGAFESVFSPHPLGRPRSR